MKTAAKVILLLEYADGFSSAISDGLQPNPNSSFQILKDSFDLSLEEYGIKERASGSIIHFVDSDGLYQEILRIGYLTRKEEVSLVDFVKDFVVGVDRFDQLHNSKIQRREWVSILLLRKYEPPILACAVNEVIASVVGENSSNMPTLIIPFLVQVSKLKLENISAMKNVKVPLHGVQIGSDTDTTKALLSKTQKLPSSLQIHHEPLALCIQLVRVIKVPTFILVGQNGQNLSRKTSEDDFKVLCELGEVLASLSSLCFIKERITWNPSKMSRETVEPWRDLYG